MSLGEVLAALKTEATSHNLSPAAGTSRLLCSLTQHRQEPSGTSQEDIKQDVRLSVSMSGCKGSECAHRGFQVFQARNKTVH
jgi:hypothetical protein